MFRVILISIFSFFALSFSAFAQSSDDARKDFGDDVFASGYSVNINKTVDGDVFAAGKSVTISAPVGDDAHLAGESITINSNIGDDVYVAGNNVMINSNIGDDLFAMGNNVSVNGNVSGNARLAGATVIVNSPINGTLIIGADSADINALIEGDFEFNGKAINFSDNAKIKGLVTINSSSDIIVPISVASADRVTINKVEEKEYGDHVRDMTGDSVRDILPNWLSIITMMAALFIIGIIWLALFKKTSHNAYLLANKKPLKSTFFGILSLAAFIGLIPVVAMTLIGIPLVPIVIILLVFAVLIGYIAGAFFIGAKVLGAFNLDISSMGGKAIALISGLIGVWLLSFIPFIGWLICLFILFFGLGGIMHASIAKWIDKDFATKMIKEIEAK